MKRGIVIALYTGCGAALGVALFLGSPVAFWIGAGCFVAAVAVERWA